MEDERKAGVWRLKRREEWGGGGGGGDIEASFGEGYSPANSGEA